MTTRNEPHVRRIVSFVTLAMVTAIGPADGSAQDVAVPMSLQAELMVKVATYDKNFKPASGRTLVLIVTKSGAGESERAAAQMARALKSAGGNDSLAVDSETIAFKGAEALAQLCKQKQVGILYVAPGLSESETKAIGKAFVGANILSVGAEPLYVQNGIVLGFDMVSGKPQLLFHLAQARAQNVAIRSQALRLMKVFE